MPGLSLTPTPAGPGTTVDLSEENKAEVVQAVLAELEPAVDLVVLYQNKKA